MIALVLVLMLAVILELAACQVRQGFIEKALSCVGILLIADSSLLLLMIRPSVWSVLLTYISIFRVINQIKLIDERKTKDYLKASVRRSSIFLVLMQLIVLVFTELIRKIGVSNNSIWDVLALVELLGLMIMMFSLKRGLSKTHPSLEGNNIEESQLPTVTVAIPARNESQDLEDCLVSLLSSDYPKLEVIVLDDCSQTRRTPEIIRQFAHDGVMFLAGKPPGDSWTAKNFAYEQLASEANGEVLLFCGVDIRLETAAIRKMIELKIKKNKQMMSFMPVNLMPASKIKSLLIQPMRYLWELGLPRRSFNRPPVLSTCWLIDSKVLENIGSFKSVSRSIIPERIFARQIAKAGDGYSFVCSGKEVGLTSQKTFDDQRDTAIRMRYPMLRQRLENVCSLEFIEVILFILPIFLVVCGLVSNNVSLLVLSVINMMIASLITYLVVKLAYMRSISLGLILYPVIYIYDKWLLLVSMYKYEFSEVVWKGRNVCIPVMQIVQQLPNSDSELK